MFDETYRQAWASGYRGLTPASDYNIDYAMYGVVAAWSRCCATSGWDMQGAGLRWEAVKGECNRGQQEIGFRYDEALVTCDNHSIYKNGAKEIADQHGKSLTFMAKYDEREGNSCHIHLSLRAADGSVGGVCRRRSTARHVVEVPQLRRRPAGHAARTHVVLCAEHQLLQAICRRQLRAYRGGVGTGQPHLRAACRRSRTTASGWNAGCPAETSTSTSRWRR